jgi:leader peptidase (prepilin peptidase)/N-methyltransferase
VSALSAAGGYLVFAAVAWTAERYYREPALGQGDWKLAALVGALFGWRGLLLTVLLGTLAGALVGIALMVVWRRSGRAHVPLGTFLCAGALAVMLWGEPILRWYGAFTDV